MGDKPLPLRTDQSHLVTSLQIGFSNEDLPLSCVESIGSVRLKIRNVPLEFASRLVGGDIDCHS
jgi:hypothetical protein